MSDSEERILHEMKRIIVELRQSTEVSASHPVNMETLFAQVKELHENAIVLEYMQRNTAFEEPTPSASNAEEADKHTRQSLADRMQHRPVKDLHSAIDMNLKFQFINQLFGGDTQTYHAAIEQLNSAKTLQEATEYLKENHQFPPENDAAQLLYELLERKFS